MRNNFRVKIWVVVLSLLGSVSSLAEVPDLQSSIPFFSEPSLTPKWLGEDEVGAEGFHRIADFELIDQNGQLVGRESLRGKLYLANFFFTTCPGICSTMTGNLKRVQAAFKGPEEIKILSHSVTPDYDSVSLLKEYEAKNGISGDIWHLLTGEKESIYSLARDSYFADDAGSPIENAGESFLHTEKVFLIDRLGRIRGVYNGVMTVDMKRIIDDVKTLLEEH